MFSTAPVAAPVQPQAAPAAPVEQNQQQTQQQVQEPQSPLDAVGNIWETKKGEQKLQQSQEIDFDALDKSVSGLNFTSGVDPALLQKIEQGGPEATQAMMQIVNRSSQEAFKQSAVVMTKMFEQFKQQMQQEAAQTAGAVYNRNQTESALFGQQDVLAHPNVKPLAQILARQLKQQFPKESPQQIATRTREMLTQMGKDLNTDPAKVAQEKQAAETNDWDSWFGANS